MATTDNSAETGNNGVAANLAAARERAQKLAEHFDRRQRTLMAVAFAGTIGAVLAFAFLGTRTEWAPLMTNLNADDASAVTKQLEANGTEFQLADGGSTVEVPIDVVDQARLDIAAVDMPSSGTIGYGILDQQDLTSSDFSQRIGFQRAMEGELTKTIESIDTVSAATVHLAIPKNDTFALDEQKATASVMVTTQPGASLAGRQVQAIQNLVAGAIEGLSPKDVTVADSEGNVLAAPGAAPGSTGADPSEMQASYEGSLSSSIESLLAAIVGPGKAKVTVSAQLDFDSTQQVSETYSPPSTIVAGQSLAVNEATKEETYNGSGNGTNASGILGPDGLPLAAGAAAAGNGYQLSEKQVNNAVNKVVETKNKAPGAVQRLSVAVVVDEQAVDATQLPDLQAAVTAAAGLDTTRGDTVSLTRFPLDDSEQKAAAKELAFREKQAKAAAEAAGIPTWAMAGGGVVLLLVLVMMLRGRKKRKAQMAELLAPLELGSGENLPAEQIITIEATPRSNGVTDVSDGQLPGVAGIPGASTVDAGLDRREALGDLIDNQPDEVAQLLRSWLGDRREVAR